MNIAVISKNYDELIKRIKIIENLAENNDMIINKKNVLFIY